MSVLPEGFDPRAQIVGIMDLVSIEAPSGLARFMVGQEGVFRDRDGNAWYGSQLISASALAWSRDGKAPAGGLTLSYFQDPTAPDLIERLREGGDLEIRGAPVRFYIQPVNDRAELYAPRFAPILIATRAAGPVTVEIINDLQRSLSLAIEGPVALRRTARGLNYTVSDHARLIGSPNPSLEYMPQIARPEEKLFG